MLCAECFAEQYGSEPDMDNELIWQPGECAQCQRNMIVFSH